MRVCVVEGGGGHACVRACVLGGRLDTLHCEVEGHELTDRLQAAECRTHCNTSEACLHISHPFSPVYASMQTDGGLTYDKLAILDQAIADTHFDNDIGAPGML